MREPIRSLLQSLDPAHITQAVELLRGLHDDALTAAVIADLSAPPEWMRRIRLLLAGHFPHLLHPPRIVTLRDGDLDHLWCLRGPHLRLFRLTLSNEPRSNLDLSELPPLPGLVSLRLRHLSIRSLDGLPAMPSLRSLSIHHLPPLRALEPSDFPALENLTVRLCPALDHIGTLPGSLDALSVTGCQNLKAVDGLSRAGVTRLELASVPTAVLEPPLQLPRLRHLHLRHVGRTDLSHLKTIPETLSLQGGAVSGLCAVTRSLRLDNTALMDTALPKLPPSAAVAIRGSTSALRALDGLEAAQVSALDLSDCRSLEDISALRGSPLKRLRLLRARRLKDVSPLQSLGRLESLSLSGLFGAPASLETMGLTGLPALRTLRIHQSGRLGSLHGIGSMPSLHEVTLTQCRKLRDFRGLEQLSGLERLDLRQSLWAGEDAQVTTGPAARATAAWLGRHTPRTNQIHRYWIHTNASSSKWPLEDCRRMSLTSAWSIPPLSRARDLQVLILRSVRGDLTQLGPKPALHSLFLHGTHNVDLSVLPPLTPGLRRLSLRYSLALKEPSALAAWPALEDLTLANMRTPIPLAGLTRLRTLRVDRQFPPHTLDVPPGVTALVLWGAAEKMTQTPPPWAPQIRSLVLTRAGHRDLRTLAPLLPYTGLRTLVLENSRIDDARALREGFPLLETADLRGSLLPGWMRQVWSGKALEALRARL